MNSYPHLSISLFDFLGVKVLYPLGKLYGTWIEMLRTRCPDLKLVFCIEKLKTVIAFAKSGKVPLLFG